ncbi:MAG: sulfate transporter CysZ [Marinagarivorans sp.]|nr:sulfate transporter CysZ [Marinagarivorans sp.]
MLKTLPNNNLATGAHYFIEGINLLRRKELRLYILVPLVVNVIIFITLTGLFMAYFSGAMAWIFDYLPSFLHFLKWILWPLIGVFFLLCYGYAFNTITNIVAAPFYGLLAQKTEELVTGICPPDEPLKKLIPRVIDREVQKLLYFIGRGLLVLLVLLVLGLIGITSPLVPIVGVLWGAWCMSIQYVDYACDNNQLDFLPMRKRLRENIYSSTGFGGMVMMASMIPIVNIFAMPAAVTGGTAFWIKELK